MHRTKWVANLLFYIANFVAVLIFLTGAYAVLILCLSFFTGIKTLPITISNSVFVIFYPFSKTPFLTGDYTKHFMFLLFGTTFLYACFLWLLAGVFNAYRQSRLFITKNVNRLRNFYVFNLLAPVLVLISLLLSGESIQDVLVILLLHIMLGVFTFFMAEIFKQGLSLQEEQDLTF